jgi:hypothetical protein
MLAPPDTVDEAGADAGAGVLAGETGTTGSLVGMTGLEGAGGAGAGSGAREHAASNAAPPMQASPMKWRRVVEDGMARVRSGRRRSLAPRSAEVCSQAYRAVTHVAFVDIPPTQAAAGTAPSA